MKTLVVGIFVCFCSFNIHAATILDVSRIAGKSKKEVSSLIGQALSCSQMFAGEKCIYSRKTEIVFIDGKADWITVVEGMDDVPFNELALNSIGLKSSFEPSFKNEHVLRWSYINGLRRVTIFPGLNNNCHFAYINAFTKPLFP